MNSKNGINIGVGSKASMVEHKINKTVAALIKRPGCLWNLLNSMLVFQSSNLAAPIMNAHCKDRPFGENGLYPLI